MFQTLTKETSIMLELSEKVLKIKLEITPIGFHGLKED